MGSSGLTEPEIGAVLQLIQLSGSSVRDFQVFLVNFHARKQEDDGGQERELKPESVGEASSSSSSSLSLSSASSISTEKYADEALPRGRNKFRTIADIYQNSTSHRPPTKENSKRAKII